MTTKLTEISPTAGIPEVGEPINARVAWAYVIVRTTTLGDGDTLVNMVYGPYDEQGANAAYRKLRAAGLADGDSNLFVRGLCATGDSRSLDIGA